MSGARAKSSVRWRYSSSVDEIDSIDTFDNQADNAGAKEGDKTMGQPAVERVDLQAERGWVTTGKPKRILGVSSRNTVKRWVSEGKLCSGI